MSARTPAWNEDDVNTYALTTASAAAGCALGILLGRGMSKTASNITALSLLAVSATVVAPTLKDFITRVVNRPGSARGSRKRLQGIRDGALPEDSDEIYATDFQGS